MRQRMLGVVVTVLAVLSGARAAVAPAVERFVVRGEQAIFMLRPRLLCTGQVHWARLSADGRYALAWRSEELPEIPELARRNLPRHSLVLWNSTTGQARDIYSIRAENVPEADFYWMGSANSALGYLAVSRVAAGQPTQVERWLFRFDTRSGQLKAVQKHPPSSSFLVSPKLGAALITGEHPPQVLKPDGTLVTVKLPEAFGRGQFYWARDGRTAVTGRPVDRQHSGPCALVDASTGAVAFQDQAPPEWTEPEPPVHVQHDSTVLDERRARVTLKPAWLESRDPREQPRCLLAASAEWVALTPAADAAIYADANAAWLVGLVRMPKTAFIAARREDARQRAKNLANALMMYSQDYDEVLPGNDQVIQEIITPYVRQSARMFDGFVYTYSGGPLAAIADPGKTVLGYVQGPDGLMNIYADGHVGWASRQ